MLILNKEELEIARETFLEYMNNVTFPDSPDPYKWLSANGTFDGCSLPSLKFHPLILWSMEYPITEDDKPPSKHQV